MYAQDMPTGTVLVQFAYGGDDLENSPSLTTIEQTIRQALPVGDLYPVGSVLCPAGAPEWGYCDLQLVATDACPQLVALFVGESLTVEQRRAAAANPLCDTRNLYGATATYVADGDSLAALTGATGDDLRAAQQVLAAGGVVVRSPLLISDGEVTLAVLRPDPEANPEEVTAGAGEPTRGRGGVTVWPGETAGYVTLPGHLLTTGVGPGPAIIAPATVARLGLASVESMLVGPATRMPTATDMERARLLLEPIGASARVEYGYQPRYDGILLVLLAASAIITIGAASVSTALAAADSRQDLSTLAAVGASPWLRRGLSVSQSWVIAGLGSVLGTVAGVGTALAVLGVYQQTVDDAMWPFDGVPSPVLPWSTLVISLVLVPAIAVLGAGLFTRSRLPIERRL
jgi:putative ABC transport system permease protein